MAITAITSVSKIKLNEPTAFPNHPLLVGAINLNLCLFVPAMKGEIINCSPHKDIYFLETNTKNEVTTVHI